MVLLCLQLGVGAICYGALLASLMPEQIRHLVRSLRMSTVGA
jgi:hypothetical protein